MLLGLPFICGVLSYVIGSYSIVSSLLFFVGGYVLIKNVFDYRMVRKNIMKCIDNDKKMEITNDDGDIGNDMLLDLDRDKINSVSLDMNINEIGNDMDVIEDYVEDNNKMEKIDKNESRNRYRYKYRGCDNIHGLKSTRRYIKIRRRY